MNEDYTHEKHTSYIIQYILFHIFPNQILFMIPYITYYEFNYYTTIYKKKKIKNFKKKNIKRL